MLCNVCICRSRELLISFPASHISQHLITVSVLLPDFLIDAAMSECLEWMLPYDGSTTHIRYTFLEDCGIWIARYNNTTTSNAKSGEPYADTAYDYEFWQYSSVAKVSGYTGNLDVNFWYKDTSAKTGGLKATVGNAFDPVKLSWGKAADDVTGYRVYRYDEKQKKYVYMKQTSGKSFTDTDVTSGKTYQYRVRCFWTIGGTNYYGNYSSVVSATVPPAKVSDVKTQKRSSTYVTLGWSKISGSSGYRVYKYNTAEKKYESVATIAAGDFLPSADLCTLHVRQKLLPRRFPLLLFYKISL